MRLKLSRALYATILLCLLLLFWHFFRENSPKFTKTCELATVYQNSLLNLSYRVHNVLEIVRVTHCLCYGALWGQVRRSTTLPWEKDAEFCVDNKELMLFDENFLHKVFQKHNLVLSYDSGEGVYTVVDNFLQQGAAIHLVVFEEDVMLDMMRRIGWKRRMLPPNCEDSKSLDCFPVRLLRKPLPMKSFGWKKLPVPWEELEILKYHFPDNWWQEVFPLNC